MTAGVSEDPAQILHAGCVAVAGRGLLILGPSGSGKSALALKLLSMGAELVSDDRTAIESRGDALIARSPKAVEGLIEARGVGILRVPFRREVAVELAVDMAQAETDRLPPRRKITLHGCEVDLVLAGAGDHFPAALWLYLLGGRQF